MSKLNKIIYLLILLAVKMNKFFFSLIYKKKNFFYLNVKKFDFKKKLLKNINIINIIKFYFIFFLKLINIDNINKK